MKFDLHQLSQEKFLTLAIKGGMGLLILLILLQIISLFYSKTSSLDELSPVLKVQPEISDYKVIVKANLFGHYVPKDLNHAGIKQSLLDVEIAGILFSQKNEESQVILKESNGEQKIYKVGDSLPGGAVLKKILPNGIVVERDGELERLDLAKDELHFQPSPKPMKEENNEF